MAGVIHPLVWEVSDQALARFRDYTVFSMPPELYETLAAAFKTESEDGLPSVPQSSLEQLIGWFAPDVAFVKREPSEQSGKHSLHIYYLGHCERVSAIKDLLDAFQLWLAVSGPKDRDAGLDDRLLDAVENDQNWSARELDLTIDIQPGRCVRPRDDRVFNIATQAVAGYLAGQPIVLDYKNWGRLILSGLKGDPFSGRELILFPPEQAENEGHIGHWSEFIRIAAMTSPESRRLRIVASLHVRNYGALTAQARFNPRLRRLDVFFRARGAPAGGFRHGEIPFRLVGTSDQNVRPVYSYRHGADLFRAVRGFPGGADIDSDRIPFEPIYGDGGLWMMPRLGRGSGDRNLPVGHGMGWTDREAFAVYLDGRFSDVGLERIERLERVRPASGFTVSCPWWNPSRPTAVNSTRLPEYEAEVTSRQKRRRQLVKQAAGDVALRIALFRLRDEAEGELRESLIELFGVPEKESKEEIRFEDGLLVQLAIVKSGILAEPLPDRPELDAATAARTNKSKHGAILAQRFRRLLEEHDENIQAYAMQATSPKWRDGNAWIALVEMPENLRGRNNDPYASVYRVIARIGGLPQALLTDWNGNASEYKVPNGLRDLIRMRGVAGFDKIRDRRTNRLPNDVRLVGLWTVRSNQSLRTFPMAVMHESGILKVALPNPDERTWAWIGYAEACVRIGAGQVASYSRLRQVQRREAFSQFYREVLESLVLDGIESVVMADAANVRQELATLSNTELELGAFEISGLPAAQPLRINDRATCVSIVRLNSSDAKRATYCRYGARGNVSGTFKEPGRARTYWAVRTPALSLSGNWDLKAAMLASRREVSHAAHPLKKSDAEYLHHDRVAPALEEVIVIARSQALDADALAGLVRKLQLTHVSWSSATVLPYPLHEARSLADHLK